MKRILILHALLGGGHRTAALALGEAFARHPGVEARVEDALDHVNPLVRRLWQGAYTRLSQSAPLLYRAFYNASDADEQLAGARANLRSGRLSRIFLSNIERLIAGYRPDAVICTMQFPLMLMSHMHHTGELAAPLFVAVTDFVAHGSWIAAGSAGYFVPSEETARAFARKGVAPKLIHVSGIPIRLEATTPKSAPEMRRRHGLPLDRPLVLLSAGGLDPRRAQLIIEQILASPRPLTLAIVAGRNTRLAAELGQKQSPASHITLALYGAIPFLDDLLAASDLVIGKSGGLITSEALARGVPQLIIDPIPGQEEWNADYICGAGAGVQLRMAEAVAPTVLALIDNPALLSTMSTQAQTIARPHAAHTVAANVLASLA